VRRGTNGFDFGEPLVRGGRTDRHLGLAWGDCSGPTSQAGPIGTQREQGQG
jgi:hypothetical protein